MLNGIVINDLPLTFQDAVNITRNLGYQYLWIDSLCIIQDDPDDWAFESSTMSRVYSNSILTIAALWGNDSHSGCFVERNPLVAQDCLIGTWKHGNVIVRSGTYKHTHTLRFLEPKPLLYRAWVLQERFLSPRTLFYGPWELYWECCERATNESIPEGREWLKNTLKFRFRSMKETELISRKTSLQGRLWHHMRRKLWGSANDHSPKYTRLESNYIIWTEIRAEYWSSNLTYHSDTLVAISGVTDVFEQRTGLHFVFGLCMEFLCSELLWQVDKADETTRSTLAPTWSWASVEKARLHYIYDQALEVKHGLISIFHTRTESFDGLKGRDRSFDSNCLHLHGPLLRTTLERDNYGDFMANNDRLPRDGYSPDIHLPDTVDVVCLVVVTGVTDIYWPEGEGNSRAPGPSKFQAGLMLVPSSHNDSTYERVGVWIAWITSQGLEARGINIAERGINIAEREINITEKDMQSFWLI
ncbi:MAG: hypothetical protein Q9198_002681 [Flavoplaca austrocitrina]